MTGQYGHCFATNKKPILKFAEVALIGSGFLFAASSVFDSNKEKWEEYEL